MGRLFWKFFIFLFLAQLTTVLGVGLGIWFQTHQAFEQTTAIETSPPAESIIEAASSTLKFGGISGLKELLTDWNNRPMPKVYVIDETGHEVLQRKYSTATWEYANKIKNNFELAPYVKEIKLTNGHSYLMFVPQTNFSKTIQPDGPPPFDNVKSGKMMPPPNNFVSRLKPPEIPGVHFPFETILAGGFVSLFFAALLAWYFSKPIKILHSAFISVSGGKLDFRVGNKMRNRKDELADLGKNFDFMITRIESLLQSQKALLHHVSHELRSPLARIQIAIGLTKQNEEKIPSLLDRIQNESDRMDSLIDDLLRLSSLESGVISMNLSKIYVSALLNNIIEDARLEADVKGIKIISIMKDYSIVIGDLEFLHRAIENVLRNAIKYSFNESKVLIETSSKSTQNYVSIIISDHGPGVPYNELEKIFLPFVRSSNVNSKEGHGVGLAITKQIIEAHGGKICAKNRPSGGLSVEIELPRE